MVVPSWTARVHHQDVVVKDASAFFQSWRPRALRK
jgi:hypothetical protein